MNILSLLILMGFTSLLSAIYLIKRDNRITPYGIRPPAWMLILGTWGIVCIITSVIVGGVMVLQWLF